MVTVSDVIAVVAAAVVVHSCSSFLPLLGYQPTFDLHSPLSWQDVLACGEGTVWQQKENFSPPLRITVLRPLLVPAASDDQLIRRKCAASAFIQFVCVCYM